MNITLRKPRWVSDTSRLNSNDPLPTILTHLFVDDSVSYGYFHTEASWYRHGESVGYRNRPVSALIWN